MRTTAMDDWRGNAMQAANPQAGPLPPAPTPEVMENLQKRFTQEYEALFAQPIRVNSQLPPTVNAMRQQAMDTLPGKLGKKVNKTLQDLQILLSKTDERGAIQGRIIDTLDDVLRDAAKATDYSAEAQFYQQARQALRKAVDPQVAAKWQQLDSGYARFAAMRKASEYKRVQKRGGDFSPSDLVNASKGRLGKEAKEAYEALGNFPRPNNSKNLFDRATNIAAESAMAGPGLLTRILANEPMRRRLVQWMLNNGMKPDIKAISPEVLDRFIAAGGLAGATSGP